MAVSVRNNPDDGSPASLPRVLHVVDADHFERFGRMFRQLGLALADAGVDVALLTDDADAAVNFEGTPIVPHYFPTLHGWGVWRLHAYLRREFNPPPEIVHLWGTGGIGYLGDWTQHAGAKLLIHVTSLRDLERLKRRGLHPNERVLAGCREFYEQLCERWPAAAAAVRLHPPALLRPERVSELPPRGRTLGVLCVCKLERGSGVNVLIDALAQLRDQDCDFHVALIGDGSATREYWRKMRSLRVQSRFSIVPEPHIWDQTIDGADVFVVPAPQNELNLAPLMAMSLGKVVIAARDQLAEWFVEDETALQFTPGSAVELAYHLSRVAARLPGIRALARNAAEYVSKRHAVTRLADELAAYYAELAPQSRERTGAAPARVNA